MSRRSPSRQEMQAARAIELPREVEARLTESEKLDWQEIDTVEGKLRFLARVGKRQQRRTETAEQAEVRRAVDAERKKRQYQMLKLQREGRLLRPIQGRGAQAAPLVVEELLREREIISRTPQMAARYNPREMFPYPNEPYGLPEYQRTPIETGRIDLRSQYVKLKGLERNERRLDRLSTKVGGDPREFVRAGQVEKRILEEYEDKQRKRAFAAKRAKEVRKSMGLSKADTNPYFLKYDKKSNSIVEIPVRTRSAPVNVVKVNGETWQQYVTRRMREEDVSMKKIAEDWAKAKIAGDVEISKGALYKMKYETNLIDKKPIPKKLQEHIRIQQEKSVEDKAMDRVKAVNAARERVLAMGLARPSSSLRKARPEAAYYGGEYLRTNPYKLTLKRPERLGGGEYPSKRGVEREADLAAIFAANELKRQYETASGRGFL